jgi:hypothetical protein
MPSTTAASFRPAKIARLSQALRRSWTQARLVDRELMALRTDLSRQAGWGQHAQ